jgi:hypothetical protein
MSEEKIRHSWEHIEGRDYVCRKCHQYGQPFHNRKPEYCIPAAALEEQVTLKDTITQLRRENEVMVTALRDIVLASIIEVRPSKIIEICEKALKDCEKLSGNEG